MMRETPLHGWALPILILGFCADAIGRDTETGQEVEIRADRLLSDRSAESIAQRVLPSTQSITSIQPDDWAISPAVRLEDLAMAVPGVLIEPVNAGLSSAVKMRGFAVTRLHRDGLPDVQRMYVRDLATVSRVDFLQGPAGALAGVAAPGGMVQFVGKRPQAAANTHFQAVTGTQAFGRLVLDSTGPLDGDAAHLRYRLIAVAQNGHADPAHLPERHQQGLAALEWHYDAGWVGIDLQEQRNQTPFTFGTVITNGGVAGRAVQTAEVAWDRVFVLPGGAPADRRYHDTRLQWHHRLPADWSMALTAAQSTVTRDETLLGYWAITSPTSLSSYWTRYHDSYRQRAARLDVQRQLQHGEWRHDVRVGADHYQQGFLFDGQQNIGAFSIDVANPQAAAWSTPPAPTSRRYNDERIQESGVWLADQAHFGADLDFTAMTRHQSYTIESTRVPAPRKAVGSAGATIWVAGMSWRPASAWRVFASRATGMDANRGTLATGGFLEPQTALQTEAGLHVQHGPLQITGNLWRIDLNHLAMADPLDRTALVAAGGRRVQGMQAMLLLDSGDWGGTGTVSVQRTRQTVRTSSSLGDRFVGVPDHQASLQTWWRLPLAAAQPVTLAAGLTGVGPRMADAANTVRVPGFARIDVSLRVRSDVAQGQWTLQVRNVADLRYVAALTRVDDVYQGARRQAWLGWQGRW